MSVEAGESKISQGVSDCVRTGSQRCPVYGAGVDPFLLKSSGPVAGPS